MGVETDRSGREASAPNGAAALPSADDDRAGRRLDGLIGMLSHDLRTPLSAISGWLFLLESGKLDGEGQKRALAKIRASVDEQVRLIDDTLAISRSATGGLEVESAPFDVAELLAAVVAAAKPIAEAKGVALDSEALAGPSAVVGDRARLQRALELLLAHAIKATPAPGRVGVTGRADAAAVLIAIVDGGPGIAPDELRWVLDPFGRPPDGGGHGARGVERGLLLANALITAQGGRLRIASEGPGHGESFTVSVPTGGCGAATTG
jgi:signal transduction histidine kinase